MKRRTYPRQEGTIGSTWAMDTGRGCWAYVLCVGERRVNVGNYPCLMLACSELGWSSTRSGAIINVSLGGAVAWKRLL